MTDELQAMPEDWTRALAVVAHPDDMEFGAAGAVAAWTAAGKSVSYLLATRGEAGIAGMEPERAAAVREDEQRASAAIVGVEQVEFLDHRDGVVEGGLALRRDFTAAIRRHRPELVIGFNHHDRFVSGRWNTPDHRETGRALLDAVGDAGNRWIFPEPGLEPWGGVRYVAMSNSPHATHAVDITAAVDKAVASLEAHAAYLAALVPPVSDVRGPLVGLARSVGERFGGTLAISFELVPR
ncbi:PIG-L deacetylase family protein [Saccharothrix sp. ST-888]|uniref:PIG-L deacetylase family protein n=1 Tax=Saccharothrix sp. ST-888 TaxID=1427391 RepID=UPI0005EC92C1|nr:PIG-L deacetylase family protein [Saccharothrix sp. ST-888]KJK59197.1 GlcNAc-PI de-N-acetylase [Saccharothrix sp. ST-888]